MKDHKIGRCMKMLAVSYSTAAEQPTAGSKWPRMNPCETRDILMNDA